MNWEEEQSLERKAMEYVFLEADVPPHMIKCLQEKGLDNTVLWKHLLLGCPFPNMILEGLDRTSMETCVTVVLSILNNPRLKDQSFVGAISELNNIITRVSTTPRMNSSLHHFLSNPDFEFSAMEGYALNVYHEIYNYPSLKMSVQDQLFQHDMFEVSTECRVTIRRIVESMPHVDNMPRLQDPLFFFDYHQFLRDIMHDFLDQIDFPVEHKMTISGFCGLCTFLNVCKMKKHIEAGKGSLRGIPIDDRSHLINAINFARDTFDVTRYHYMESFERFDTNAFNLALQTNEVIE